MKILVFTGGTTLMHKNAIGHTRNEIVQQVKNNEPSVRDCASYVPIGKAAKKLIGWKEQGAEILYVTSRITEDEVQSVENVLKQYGFPEGQLLFRQNNERYKDIVERLVPDVLIEDDCESIGGVDEMMITHVDPATKEKITAIAVKEFGGIDHLPDTLSSF